MNDHQDALERACATTGINAEGARLLRIGSNAVYRLKAPVIARVSRPGADPGQVRRLVLDLGHPQHATRPGGRGCWRQ